MSLDQEKLELEKLRFTHQQRIDEMKLELEKLKLQSESRFANRHLASIVTGAVSFAAVVVSLSQIFVAHTSKQKELEMARIQKTAEMQMNATHHDRDWNLKVAEFIATHQGLFFGNDREKQARISKVMLVTFPPQITAPLFEKLAIAADTPSEKSGWSSAQSAASRLLLVRIDGVYQATTANASYYLRFFPDGTVMSVTSTGNPMEVARWLKPGSHDSQGKVAISRGKDDKTFIVQGSSIKFSTTSREGTVDYEGTISGDKLRLNTFSHINGHRGTEEYTFVPLGS